MIVSRARRYNFLCRIFSDLEVGDFVRRKGVRGVGLVETVSQGFAWVAWKDGRKDYLPLMCLRRCRASGSEHDRKLP